MPFSAVFVELFFVMSSIWTDSYYMIFGFVLVAFLILAVVCAEVSIITTYIRLSAENYKWWWPSIIVPGSTSLHVLVYSAVYFLKLESSLWVNNERAQSITTRLNNCFEGVALEPWVTREE